MSKVEAMFDVQVFKKTVTKEFNRGKDKETKNVELCLPNEHLFKYIVLAILDPDRVKNFAKVLQTPDVVEMFKTINSRLSVFEKINDTSSEINDPEKASTVISNMTCSNTLRVTLGINFFVHIDDGNHIATFDDVAFLNSHHVFIFLRDLLIGYIKQCGNTIFTNREDDFDLAEFKIFTTLYMFYANEVKMVPDPKFLFLSRTTCNSRFLRFICGTTFALNQKIKDRYISGTAVERLEFGDDIRFKMIDFDGTMRNVKADNSRTVRLSNSIDLSTFLATVFVEGS